MNKLNKLNGWIFAGNEQQYHGMKLHGEVMACGYEDVHVMWSILDKTKSLERSGRSWRKGERGQRIWWSLWSFELNVCPQLLLIYSATCLICCNWDYMHIYIW